MAFSSRWASAVAVVGATAALGCAADEGARAAVSAGAPVSQLASDFAADYRGGLAVRP
jgi:hypothetical protein